MPSFGPWGARMQGASPTHEVSIFVSHPLQTLRNPCLWSATSYLPCLLSESHGNTELETWKGLRVVMPYPFCDEKWRPQMLCDIWWGAEPVFMLLLLSQHRVVFSLLNTDWLHHPSMPRVFISQSLSKSLLLLLFIKFPLYWVPLYLETLYQANPVSYSLCVLLMPKIVLNTCSVPGTVWTLSTQWPV